MTTFFLITLFLCLLGGAPLFIVIGGLALVFFSTVGDITVVIADFYRMTKPSMLPAIPLFTFAGYLLAESKSPGRFVNLYKAFFSWMPGGMAIVSLIACAFFTAFTGASGVTIIALGGLLYPMLIKEKYKDNI